MFDFKGLDDEKSCKYAILKLSRGASLWYEGLKAKRAWAGKGKITSSESLKSKLRKRYVPTTYRLTTYPQAKAKLSYGENGRTWRNEGGMKGASSSLVVEPTPKTISTSEPFARTPAPKETRLSKVRCFKCQGFGHYQNSCPKKRLIALREAVACRDELFDKEERLGDVFNFEEREEEEEYIESYTAPNYDCALVLRALQAQSTAIESEERNQIFHPKCQVKDKWCSLIIDGGSCTNVASEEIVSKLGLATTPHPKPYALHWLDDGDKVKVTKQVEVDLTMGSYGDYILCDVMSMDACHVLLGCPWQFDRNATHRGRSNEYELVDKGKTLVLKPMAPSAVRSMRTTRGKAANMSMFASEHEVGEVMKESGCNYLMVVNEVPKVGVKNDQLAVLLKEFRDVFPEELPPGLPAIRGMEHQIDLISGASLPNTAAYRCNPMETKELQCQIEELMGRGYVRESLSPCDVPTILVPKNDGTWRIRNEEEHFKHLREVFDTLRRQKLYGKKEKCSFLVESIIFLGYVVSNDGVFVDQAMIEAIKSWSTPKSVTEQKLILGHAKRVEVLQSFNTSSKYKNGKSYVVVDALSRRYSLLNVLSVRLLGFETLKNYYDDDPDFGELFEKCKSGAKGEFAIQDDFIFKGNRLCVPKHQVWEL
ncbi:uncharacterized protein LOC141631401 [Silene latifolia]|uniref:uncharacterized protein LOC141631401 n=1 Tax=Silene latifolia TaxID=37657 RepID=UPI003D7872C4